MCLGLSRGAGDEGAVPGETSEGDSGGSRRSEPGAGAMDAGWFILWERAYQRAGERRGRPYGHRRAPGGLSQPAPDHWSAAAVPLFPCTSHPSPLSLAPFLPTRAPAHNKLNVTPPRARPLPASLHMLGSRAPRPRRVLSPTRGTRHAAPTSARAMSGTRPACKNLRETVVAIPNAPPRSRLGCALPPVHNRLNLPARRALPPHPPH